MHIYRITIIITIVFNFIEMKFVIISFKNSLV